MSKLCQKLSITAFSISILLGTLTSVLASLNPSPQHCSVIADHAGCVLNRPIDIQRRLEKADYHRQLSVSP